MSTYHFFAEEVEPLQCSHSLRSGLNVSVDNMRLPTHVHPPRHNVKHWPVGREQHVQRPLQLGLIYLFLRQIFEI
jgi:hypothetical protein